MNKKEEDYSRETEDSEEDSKENSNRKKTKREGKYRRGIEILKLIIFVIVLIGICFATYYLFFYTKTCSDRDCFSKALVLCERAKWLNDDAEATWIYTIKENSKDKCEISVKLLQAKKGKQEIEKIEGKEMICYLPVGTLTVPEENLELCSGELKEGLQDLVIKRMHSYILENLGQINEEIGKIENLTKPL